MSTTEQHRQAEAGQTIGSKEIRQLCAYQKLSQLEARVEHLEHTVYQLLDLTEQLYNTVEKLYTTNVQGQRNIAAVLRQNVLYTHQMIQLNEERRKRSGL
jgi:hypothetical protein